MNKLFIGSLIAVLLSCGSTPSTNRVADFPKMDWQAKIRLSQYIVQGEGLYTKYCSACHQDNGEGLASLYPPLKESDYLLEDVPQAACIIQNGLAEHITVNGKAYSQVMRGLEQLTPLEIAEILTYITNSWGNQSGIAGVKEVEKWLAACE